MKPRLSTCICLLVLAVGHPTFVAAQNSPAPDTREVRIALLPERTTTEPMLNPSIHHFTDALQRVFTTRNNLFFALGATASSLVVRPYDDDISGDLHEDDFDEFEVEVPNALGSFWVVNGGALSVHLLGRLFHNPRVANTGLYLTEAVLATQVATFILKESVRRRRPDDSNDLSFPSGHASATFAVASVLERRHGLKLGIPAYLVASFVGITRVKTQKHFPTDVIAGAAVGTIIGRSFVPTKQKAHYGVWPMFDGRTAGLALRLTF